MYLNGAVVPSCARAQVESPQVLAIERWGQEDQEAGGHGQLELCNGSETSGAIAKPISKNK